MPHGGQNMKLTFGSDLEFILMDQKGKFKSSIEWEI